jgi:homoserine O-succinyltransferase
MPDAALEDTEAQFLGLLQAAAQEIQFEVTFFTLPSLPRGKQARAHLDSHYLVLAELLNDHFDGVIITGTEPHHPDLCDEPYWDELTQLMDWAEERTSSTVLSCLAAHAGVLRSDGILRQRLENKRFGVFSEIKVEEHALTHSIAAPICFPHSRWNDLCSQDLIRCGYRVLTRSTDAGVGLFVKEKKNSLFVHFQGHPEYGERTLFKEYRRDIRRFLRKERQTYPPPPQGYFDARAYDLLDRFRLEAIACPNEEILEKFPESSVVETLQKSWHSPSVSIYNSWLQYLMCKRVATSHDYRSLHATGG